MASNARRHSTSQRAREAPACLSKERPVPMLKPSAGRSRPRLQPCRDLGALQLHHFFMEFASTLELRDAPGELDHLIIGKLTLAADGLQFGDWLAMAPTDRHAITTIETRPPLIGARREIGRAHV